MYVLIVSCKNGALMNYFFLDIGRATQAKDLVAAAMLQAKEPPKDPRSSRNPHSQPWVEPAICHFYDDGGRDCHIDGSEVYAVNLIDLVQQVETDTRAAILKQRTERALLIKAGELPPDMAQQSNGFDNPTNQRAPMRSSEPDAPPAGAIGRFAS
jgi:hypothetical protein